jgi:thiamine-phosphate pyrophosphorylase
MLMSNHLKEQLKIYFISSSKNGIQPIEAAFKSGVTLFQLREKGEQALSGEALLQFALEIRQLTQKYKIPFIVNDDVNLAMAADVDGIHIGQDDIKPKDLPPFFDDKIVGLSVANSKELAISNLENVDYIGTGPVFPTQSKNDAGEAIHPEGLREMRQEISDFPMVAIGGITPDNYQKCLENGADGVAVISAIADAEDINFAVKQFM